MIGDHVLEHGVKRFGINLSGETFYDSGQMLRNLVARNPGFEGQTWQSIVRCARFSRVLCVLDGNTAWPAGFMDGATVEIAGGDAAGTRAIIRSSGPSARGYTLAFTTPLAATPADGDYLVARINKPGTPTAGWWTDLACKSTATAERQDLPRDSPSRQALRIDAAAPCQRATLTSFFDSTEGHSFVRFTGPMTVRFRAKPLAGEASLRVRLERAGTPAFLDRSVALEPGWHAYTVLLRAIDRPGATGTAGLSFRVEGGSLLLDDVSLTADSRNPTAFRDEVVATLRDLHPGILRYMDNGTDFGTSLDDWLAPVNGRPRTGYSLNSTRQDDVSIGLHEFLQLAEAIGAEPWVSLPAAFSETEARNLVDYLSGSPQTQYGSVRAALGHTSPWKFSVIHLELGNEQWNRGSFAGATLDDPAAYGQRTAAVFRAIRSAPAFQPARYDLIAGSWAEMPDYTAREAAALGGSADSLAIAPYLFFHFETAPGMEGVYGPMLAQPEQRTRDGGRIARQAEVARAAGRRLAVYELNLGTVMGSAAITQAAIDRTVPTMGAALAVIDQMLLLLRDRHVTDQCFFALPEFSNAFTSPNNSGPARTTPLYGAVVDMGGLTERRRPVFYALRMLNHAMLANLMEITTTDANPTWNQAHSPNDDIQLPAAHLLQSFAFGQDKRRSLVVLNLSRTETLPVDFSGSNAPRGAVEQTTLTAAHIEDSNELQATVLPQVMRVPHFDPAAEHRLPPFSLTTYTWATP